MDKVIGHDDVKSILQKALDENRISHAYLFTGKSGIGKKTLAIEFAKKIMTQDENDSFNETDFKIIFPEKDLIKIDQIREDVINEIYLKPVASKRKVIIIDESEKMNANAQNALLKILEEPPTYASIILVTSNSDRIINTIKSRVTEVKFTPLKDEEIKKITGLESDVALAKGSVTTALELSKNDILEKSSHLAEAILQKDFLKLTNLFKEYADEKIDIQKALELLKLIYSNDLKNDTLSKVQKINLIDETLKNLRRGANVELTLNVFMIKILN